MSKILVIGSFMMDLVAKTPRAPKEGETIKGLSFSQFAGGKGANQAVAAAKLGGDVIMTGKVGNDGFGNAQMQSLKSWGINTDYIYKDEKESTGIGFITLEESGKNRIIIIPGANMSFIPDDLVKNKQLIDDAEIIILQFEIPMETTYKSLDLSYEAGKTVILNPAPSSEIDPDYLRKVTYLILNEVEAKDFTGVDITDKENAKKAAVKLLKQGCRNVIITMGGNGVLFLNDAEEYYVPSHKVNVVDTTAAGDEFIGAFAYGLQNKYNHKECTEFANAAAALSVTRMGSQPSLPTLSEVEEFVRMNKK